MPANSSTTDQKKYTLLIVLLMIFVVFVIGAIVLGVYLSQQVENDRKVISTAFEQPSLVNKTLSDLYRVNNQFNSGEAYNFTQDSLSKVIDLIDKRMNVFASGGDLPVIGLGSNENLETVAINGATDESKLLIMNALNLWNEYKDRVDPILNNQQIFNGNETYNRRYQFYGSALWNSGAINGLSRLNLPFELNRFALALQKESDKKFGWLKFLIIGSIISALGLMFSLFYAINRLRQSDMQLDQARQESNSILSTVKDGLFLIDNDLQLAGEYSGELENIFETGEIAGRSLPDVLEHIVSEDQLSKVGRFITALFDPKVVEELIGSLNPLQDVGINVKQADGSIEKKNLRFDFFRVITRGNIDSILGSVSDVSAEVQLKDQLENIKSEHMEMFLTFMKTSNQEQLSSFLKKTASSLEDVYSSLEVPESNSTKLMETLNKAFVDVHKIKGEAYALDLTLLVEKIHQFETDLDNELKTKNKAPNVKALNKQVDGMLETLEMLELISARLSAAGVTPTDNVNTNNADLLTASNDTKAITGAWAHLKTLCDQLANEQGKKVDLIMSGFSEINLSDQNKKKINDVSAQLIENCLKHGIELPAEREILKKPQRGRIDLRVVQLPNGSIELIIRDDGRDFDKNSIVNSLVKKGTVAAKKANKWSVNDCIKQIILHAVTALEYGNEEGRGLGLNKVLNTVKSLGGRLRVSQALNNYCQFQVIFPPTTNAK